MAGRRKVGMRWFEVGFENAWPLAPLTEGARFTSLFGSWCTGLKPLWSIGAVDPCENVIDGESGPTLDRGLPCCEVPMYESLLIHDDFDDIECLSSRTVSTVSAGFPAELTREP